MGLSYFNEGRFAEALSSHEQAYTLRTQMGDKRGMSRSLTAKGLALQQCGDDDKALETLFQSVRLAEDIHDTVSMAIVYFSIGNVYRAQTKFEESLKFQQKGLLLQRATNDKTNIAYSLVGIGSTYLALNRFEDALKAYREALELHTKNNFAFGIATTLNEIGKILLKQNSLEKAAEAHEQAILLQERINDKNGLAVSYYELGQVLEAQKKPEPALQSGLKARALARETGAKVLQYQAGFFAARMQKMLGRSNDALSTLEEAMLIKDSVLNTQKAEKIAELETRFNLRSKEQQIELLAKDNALQTTTRNSLVLGIVLLLGLVVVVWLRYTEKKRANAEILRQQAILERQAREITLANQTLNEKNEQLLALNDEKNEFLGIAAHDLKNPLGSIKLLAEALHEHGTNINEERVMEMSDLISRSTEQMLAMTSNLLDINAIEQGKVHLDIHRLNCSQLLREVIQMNNHRAEAKNITFNLDAPNTSIYALADENGLSQVVDNLLSNALKYSPKGSTVKARIEVASGVYLQEENVVRISICDQGPGLTEADKRKLFGKFARLSAQPTGGEHSTGLGLSIVKRMVEQMNGAVWCESEYGKGATFIVELPFAEKRISTENINSVENKI